MLNLAQTAPRSSWDPDDWERYCLSLLRQRHGDAVIPVPDKSGGDGGLEAFMHAGTAWQCYAPENEPLRPKERYALQRGKITTDLKKLKTHHVRVSQILGSGTILQHWILLTPVHESADLVVHCNDRAVDVRNWGLPFISSDFIVSVQTLADFKVEHALLQRAGLVPESLARTVSRPATTDAGHPFTEAWGPLIEVMDGKLAKVVADETSRAFLRSEYLSARVAGDDLVAAYYERIPDIAEAIAREVSNVKRNILLRQAAQLSSSGEHLFEVRADLRDRLMGVVAGMTATNAELIADAAITTWLEECSMDFKPQGAE